jgi:DMSO/TMAO reductase YedYZ molybdopterin-dependent catalytic subunit
MNPENEEVLLEKVREIEQQKREKAVAEAGDRDNTAKILNEKRHLSEPLTPEAARKQMSQRSRRNFLIGGVPALAGVFGWRWMPEETKHALLTKTFRFNERVSQLFYRPSRLSPEFPLDRVSPRRMNGMAGMEGAFDAANWNLSIGGLAGRTEDLVLSLADIKKLPRTEMTTELKCVEGWSIIVSWAGVRFSDFAAAYLPKTLDGSLPDVFNHPEKLVPYVSMTTPDNGYYVGWDMPSILHPQTLLAYEMNGEPLLPEHGAPLRLASPTKYGIKQIKRIGRIEFTADRPKDYWAEQGYDWYSGH